MVGASGDGSKRLVRAHQRNAVVRPWFRGAADADHPCMSLLLVAPPARHLHVRFEPVVDLARGVVAGVEAVGIEGEADFARACADVRTWSDEAGAPLSLWVERTWPDAKRVRDALRRSGLPARQLVVQLAEPVLNRRGVHAGILAVRDLGAHVAARRVDRTDASLRRLRHLPVDILRLPAADASPALVRRGHELGLVVHIDGVDDAVTEARLLAEGCDFVQGARFGNAPQEEIA